MPVLVLDLGTTSLRALLVDESGNISQERRQKLKAIRPMEGLLEFDPAELAGAALALSQELAEIQPISAIGITNQRCSTLIWEKDTGIPAGNVIAWQDLRTVVDCLELQAKGLRLLPNQSATKLRWLISQIEDFHPEKYQFGTLDTWLAYCLSGNRLHITDATNAGVTGLMDFGGKDWDPNFLELLELPLEIMPEIKPSMGIFGEASAIKGSPPIAGIVGDQQSSLIGQGCLKSAQAKLTFGTGGMFNVCTGEVRPEFQDRGPHGTFPIIAWREEEQNFWGIEAAMLSAGSALDWACEKLGLAPSAAESLPVTAEDSGGVHFVPALNGLGTPNWDFGARGVFLGLNMQSESSHLLRAVLEGIANCGADLVQAGEADSKMDLKCLRVDGGMSKNSTFTQILADATQKEITVSSQPEGTSLGAAFLAGTAVKMWPSLSAAAELYIPSEIIEPNPKSRLREKWLESVSKASKWYPELSEVHF